MPGPGPVRPGRSYATVKYAFLLGILATLQKMAELRKAYSTFLGKKIRISSRLT